MKTIILNNKCYLSYKEMMDYKNTLESINNKDLNIVLLPNIAYLSLFKASKLNIGTQNFYSYNYGAYTGEVCLESLKDLNVTYTLVGHPERLELRLDSYTEIKDKLYRSLNSDFKTILCVGKDESEKMIKKELKYYLSNIEYKSFKNLIIAYEPYSKIEEDDVDLVDIELKKECITKYIKKHFDEQVTFIYGGAVNKDNIKDILSITDGVLIGRNSIDVKEIKDLIKEAI